MAKHLLGIKNMQRRFQYLGGQNLPVISLEPPNEDLCKANHSLGLLITGLSYSLLCSCLSC